MVVPLPVPGPEQAQPSRDVARAILKLPQSSPLILFVSRIDPKKGLERLLAALALPSLQGAHLVIAGTGNPAYEATLRVNVKNLGIASRVHWFGWADGQAKANLYAACDLFALPSDNENFGVAAAEAAAHGIPLVVSEGVFISADLSAAEAALVCEPSPGPLAAAIADALTQRQRAEHMSTRARALWQAKWAPAAVAQQLVSELIPGP